MAPERAGRRGPIAVPRGRRRQTTAWGPKPVVIHWFFALCRLHATADTLTRTLDTENGVKLPFLWPSRRAFAPSWRTPNLYSPPSCASLSRNRLPTGVSLCQSLGPQRWRHSSRGRTEHCTEHPQPLHVFFPPILHTHHTHTHTHSLCSVRFLLAPPLTGAAPSAARSVQWNLPLLFSIHVLRASVNEQLIVC